MSFEVFEKLEAKVQQAVETIALLQMELEELKAKNQTLLREMEQATTSHGVLIQENRQLKEQQSVWQERLQMLLGRMENV